MLAGIARGDQAQFFKGACALVEVVEGRRRWLRKQLCLVVGGEDEECETFAALTELRHLHDV